MENTRRDDEASDLFKKTARAFRTTVPKDGSTPDADLRSKIHVVCLSFPPDPLSISKIKYLRRYKSFIHEARIVCKDAGSSVKDIFDSLVPKECVLQFLHVEYSVDTVVSTVNIAALVSFVSSVHIRLSSIREDDVFNAVSTVRDADDFGIRLSGWHEFSSKYVELVQEALGESTAGSTFSFEVAKNYLVFWSEERYQSVENSTLGR